MPFVHAKDHLWSVALFRCESILPRGHWDMLIIACSPVKSSASVSSFRFHRWLANLRALEIEEIESVSYALTSHPFVERRIGTAQLT
jgi:hypothetical protein